MGGDRYVLLGLAPARAEWFSDVARWATAASIPAEFVKCVSVEQVQARLASGRAFSAVLFDGDQPGADRDLLAAARRAGCAALVVGDDRPGRDWVALGAAAVLPRRFGPEQLVDALLGCAALIPTGDGDVSSAAGLGGGLGGGFSGGLGGGPSSLPVLRGRVAVCCGPGGTGASTVAIALAQGLAGGAAADAPSVLLADFARHAEQAALHDAGDIVPGVQELADAHRHRRPSPDEVRSLAFRVDGRGYDLLLGLRRARAWAGLRPRAVEAGFDNLRATYDHVVIDTDADLEGEDAGGSADVEDRNVLARTAVARADCLFVVGGPGLKGTHALLRVLDDVHEFGLDPAAVVPVVARAPRHPRPRADVASAISRLGPPGSRRPLFLPVRRVDQLLRDGLRLPPALTKPLVAAYLDVAYASAARVPLPPQPERIVPGSLGSWAEDAG